MIGAVFDPLVFSIPPHALSEVDAHVLINRTIYWDRVTCHGAPVAPIKLQGTIDALGRAMCLPQEADVQQFLAMANLEEVFSANDIVRIYYSLLGKAATVEEILEWEVVECENAVFQPNPMSGVSPAQLKDISALAFVNTCCFNVGAVERYAFVVPGSANIPASHVDVSAEATVVFPHAFDGVELPFAIKSKAKIVRDLEDLVIGAEATQIWNYATQAEEFFLAILVRASEIVRAGGKAFKLHEIPAFAIGGLFVDSLEEHQAGLKGARANLVLDACARVILGAPKSPLNKMGKPKQYIRVSDGATAWRTHVSKAHEALRLMLWKKDNNFIELANIGNKHALHIDEAHPDVAYAFQVPAVG